MVRRHPSRNGKPKAAQSITRTQPFRTRYQLVVSGKNFESGSQPNWEKKENPNNSESDFTTSFHPDNIPSACHARRLYPANAPRNCNHAFTAG
jgi:hypothetical protein